MTSDSPDRPIRSPRVDKVPLGIMFMLASTVLFATSSALSKWQVATYPFSEVLLFRSAISLLTCAVLILPGMGLAVFRTHRLAQHFGRSVLQTGAQSCIVIALSLMPLAGAMAINFSAPLFATLFAAIFLGERVGLPRATALAVGFGGVLLVASPGIDSLNIGALFALANAILYGSVTATVRGMSRTESAGTLTIYQMSFMTLLFLLATPIFGFIVPTGRDLLALIGIGVVNGFGQYWWTRALSMAPPSAVGPFYYFTLVWSIVLGYLFWGDVPTATLLAGSSIVVASGLFLLWRESAKKSKALVES
ncbi:MAG: EamA family transporter [Rhodopseudomonas sp.]|nr:EamA family transporter [Rhodopseudomonas sp.]